MTTIESSRVGTRAAVRSKKIVNSPWFSRILLWSSLLVLWQVLAVVKGPFFMATPLETVGGIGKIFAEDHWRELAASLRQFSFGFLLALVIGVPIGLLMGSVRIADDFLSPFINTLFVVPKEALLPFLIIFFGVGLAYRVSVVVVFCVFIIVMQVAAGVRSVDAELLEAARSFRLPKLSVFRKVVLPASAPYVVSGIRLGLGFAIKGMIIAELWVFSGLGGLVHNFVSFRQLDLFFALVVLVILAGGLAIWAMELLQRRVGSAASGQFSGITIKSGGFWAWDYGESTWAKTTVRVSAIVLFFVSWEVVGRTADLFAVPPFTEASRELWTLVSSGEIWGPTLETLKVAAVGYVIAAVLGVGVGALIAMTRAGSAAVKPLVDLGLTTPMTILIPVLSIYVGLGFRGKVVLVVLLCVFIMAVNTAAGIRSMSPLLAETASAFGIRGPAMLRKVVLPHAFPSILTGLRLAVGQALAAALIGDLLLSVQGIGRLLLQAGDRLNMPQLLAVVLWVTLLGWALMAAARFIDRRLVPWLYI